MSTVNAEAENAPYPSMVPPGIKLIVRKKRTYLSRQSLTAPVDRPPNAAQEGLEAASKSPSQQVLKCEMTNTEVPTAPFTPLDAVPFEPAPWQGIGFLKKQGVFAVVTPHGACTAALSGYFAAYLSGRVFVPFGGARYPGTVIYTTYTANLDRSLRAAADSVFPCGHEILTQRTPRRFSWKDPTAPLVQALTGRARGEVAAVIIDVGPFSPRIKDETIDDAYAQLSAIAEEADCLVLLIVEYTKSREKNPFLRIPGALSSMRGTLLAASLPPAAMAPQSGAPAGFLLMRLAEVASHPLVVRFWLQPMMDPVEASRITWGPIAFEDPQTVFAQVAAVELSTAERAAAQVAAEIIRQRGAPTTKVELQEIGKQLYGIARSTMSSSLTVAGAADLLENVHSYDGRSFWVIPGVTPIPPWIRPSYRQLEARLPF